MKRLLYIFAFIMTLAVVSCVREDFSEPEHDDVPEGYVKIEFTANVNDPTRVDTRAVDPDGLDVNNMTLFCFNEFGLFISTESAKIVKHLATDGVSDSGIYSATIPNHTQIIHFLGNHSEGLYDAKDFPGQTESMVMANMEGGSGMLVYWSRFQMDPSSSKDISGQLADLTYKIADKEYKGVKLIRNQAKVTIDDWETDKFVVTGYRTVNIPAFGTVAPHHPQRHFKIVEDWENLDEFITLPDNQALMSDIVDINTKNEDYIFETQNSGDRQVSVIIKGHAAGKTKDDDKYYRIVLQNNDGSNFMIRRNHHYNIKITGMLTYGQNSFEEALNAPASNNAWISIDEWVNEITDGVQTLWVEKTSYVLSSDEYAGTNLKIPYKYTVNNSGDANAPVVSWIENNVAYDNIGNSYNIATGDGELTIRLYPMYEGNEQQVGSFLIKHGKLQRKVTIYVIRTQKFTPAWISAQVHGVSNENVTVMFTVPETCPEALFPFTVLISANHLDVRYESGQQLPVYVKGEEGYFGQDWEDINYKYAYTVTGPGKHRLHMKSILVHEDNDREAVHLEAEFFETVTKYVAFRGHDFDHYRIFVTGLHNYGNSYAEDEELYYMLIPQKKAAPLAFNIQLQKRNDDKTYSPLDHTGVNNAGYDEFLIYTKYLSLFDDFFDKNSEQYEALQSHQWETEAMAVNEDAWSSNGRVFGLRTYDAADVGGTKYGLQQDGNYNIYLLTNDSSSGDVVRISANNSSSGYIFPSDRNGNPYSGLYQGNEYRSVIFDMSRFRPYRFAAQVRIPGADESKTQLIPESSKLKSNQNNGDEPEDVDDVLFSYKPGQLVDILLDITSFKGSTGRSVHPFGESFGYAFDVYIDAPMLDIDYNRVPSSWLAAINPELNGVDKLRKHPTVPGRYIYTVDQKREVERQFGYAPAHNKDDARIGYDDFGRVVDLSEDVNQEGERKLLPFVKNAITTGGNIFITTDKDKVVYWDKEFQVDTEHMKGVLKYMKDGKEEFVPDNAFIAFVRQKTNARIGVVTLNTSTGGPGWFELNLRDEYTFSWEDDPIDFYYKDKSDGKVYNFNYTTENGEKKSVDLDLLYSLLENNQPIVLTEQPE